MKPGIWGPECWLQETLNAPPTGNNTRTLPPGCGKTEFLLKIKGAFVNQSEFVDGSYGSKAIFI
jgi:hypothetical protein